MINPVLRQAVSERWKSMIRKWPAIVFAGLACYGLHYLDQVKQVFDEEKARPLLVDEKFKERLKTEFVTQAGNVELGNSKWNEIERFIPVSQYSTADDFINKVVARISRANETKEFVVQAQFKGCVAKALAPPVEASKSESSGSSNAVSDAEQCSTNYIAKDEEYYRDTQDKIANTYRYLKNIPLKKIGAELAGREDQQGFFEALLKPTLDDQSGLHIIYQILRVSLVVIIAFALLAVVALLLGAIMLSDGVKTVTEQATSFIGPGKGSLFPVGRAAALTVAALGLGTAVAAGVSTNNKADQALVHHGNPVPQARKTTSGIGKGGNNPSGSPTTNYDSTNTQYAYGDTNTFYDYSDSDDSAPRLALPFVVQVYPRIRVVDSGSGSDGQNTGTVALDPSLVTTMKTYLDGLTAVNRDLSLKIGSFTPPTNKDEIKVANHVTTGNSDKPLLIDLVPASTTLISTSIKDLDAKMTSVKDLITKLDDLHNINLDRPAYPSERSRIASLFRGSDRYFVSRRALDQLADLMKGFAAYFNDQKQKLNSTVVADSSKTASVQEEVKLYDDKLKADAAITEAMKWLYLRGDRPDGKEAFLAKLKVELQQTAYFQQNQSLVMARFEFWQNTILTYTRIR